MRKKAYIHLEGFYPQREIWVNLEFYTIKQAKYFNPHLTHIRRRLK